MDFATLTPKVEALLMAAPSLEFPGCKQAGFSANRWDRKKGCFLLAVEAYGSGFMIMLVLFVRA